MNWKEDPRWAYVFVNLSCLMWASNFVLGRTLREEVGPLMLTVSRFVVASLMFDTMPPGMYPVHQTRGSRNHHN
jgi:drug/metabolite transporter (DMT)-like permease